MNHIFVDYIDWILTKLYRLYFCCQRYHDNGMVLFTLFKDGPEEYKNRFRGGFWRLDDKDYTNGCIKRSPGDLGNS